MFGISFEELLVLAVLTLILFGPEKMMEYAAKAGRLVAKARRMSEELVRQVRQAGSEYVEPLQELRQDLLAPLAPPDNRPSPPPSPYPEMHYCPRCGAKQEAVFTFCPQCGGRLK
ncbi:MAG: zinc-ribbon domain-containing protein [Syntrophobacterales bacterium]|nr:zinc-ribbon domain-containing protein [Syntrophobacterales bacterium]